MNFQLMNSISDLPICVSKFYLSSENKSVEFKYANFALSLILRPMGNKNFTNLYIP